MYGKFFTSTFTGSMFGAGADVFAVWGYVIANARDGIVELNPSMLAAVLGANEQEVNGAIDYLLAPDSKSRNDAEEGRRLIHEGGFQYRVVNHGFYRAIRNEEERRAYNREAQRRSRASRKVKQDVNDTNDLSALSAHTEADTESETRKSKANGSQARPASQDESPLIQTLPLREGGDFEVRQSLVAQLEPLYPLVDVPATVREMKGWLIGNPERRKTRRGIKRFMTNWLQSEQQKAETQQ